MFFDEADISAKGGRGGDGCASFRREKHVPHGGPDGGTGGSGGDVILRVSSGRSTLIDLHNKRHLNAADGRNGGPNNKSGARGDDLLIPVPPGTVVSDERGRILADLVQDGQRFVAARGGRGGRGNSSLAGVAGRLPGFAEKGEPGESTSLHLELKLVADVAIVGFPNAGKSTLISRISGARPRIADYPFTTTQPHLGLVEGEKIDYVVTDIPGLVEGAHEGKGMGVDFLRHIERALVILYLIDLSPDSGREPTDDLVMLERELELFKGELVKRPSLAAANKMDLDPAPDVIKALEDECATMGMELHMISAVTGEGLAPLMGTMESLVSKAREDRTLTSESVTYEARTPSDVMRVIRKGERLVIKGGSVERMVRMTDWNNDEARAHLALRLRKAGVEDLLERAGAIPGDEVEIAGRIFEYIPERERGNLRGGKSGEAPGGAGDESG